MLLFFLSILTISYVQSLTISYPYGTLLTYGSTRNPNKMTAAQGFLIYLDNMGIERIVSYNYAQPVYAIHQIINDNSEIPIYQKYERSVSSEVNKAQEAHFRTWSLQQYQVLKREIDLLRAEGKEPSIEMTLKFLPLEKIALTSDYTTIAELPEIKRLREEHLNIWNQISLINAYRLKSGAKTIPNESIEVMTAEKLVNEKQMAESEKLELLKKNTQNNYSKTNITQSLSTNQFVKNELSFSKVADEVKMNVIEPRFANNTDHQSDIDHKESFKSKVHDIMSAPLQQQFDIKKINSQFKENVEALPIASKQDKRFDDSNLEISNEQNSMETQKKHFIKNLDTGMKEEHKQNITAEKQHQFSFIAEQKQMKSQLSFIQIKAVNTSEIIKAHEENLQLPTNKEIYSPRKMHSEIQKIIATAPAIYVPKQVVDTFEVMRARDEHLRIVNEAIMKAKLAQVQKQQKEKMPDNILNGTEIEVMELTLKS